jgi:hypothetical protein
VLAAKNYTILLTSAGVKVEDSITEPTVSLQAVPVVSSIQDTPSSSTA